MTKQKRPINRRKQDFKTQLKEFWDTLRSLAIAILIALLFRSLFFEPFYIPSGSMKSTLLVGDYVFVSKYSYGYSKYSFPLGLPLFDGRVLADQPERGDVIVFRLPTDPNINYIKRLIGLPGDTIQVKEGIVYLNDTPVPRNRVENFIDIDEEGNRTEIPQYMETLPNGVSYHVLDQTHHGALDNTGVYHIPAGHYFMMGDNRDNSQDSRVLDMVGYVPYQNLMGPARMIFLSCNGSLLKIWDWWDSLRFNRFFSTDMSESD
jgi:signal peptidase I